MRKIILIVIIAAVLGGLNNIINPNRVPWVGYWPNVTDTDTVWLSLSYEEGDPPTLRLQDALDRFIAETHIFVDAREPEEYAAGHIRGAINLPHDYFDEYWPKVEPLLPKDTMIVTYCSGTECESSLYLARLLVEEFGYKNVEIFYGGWRMWTKHELPTESEYGNGDSH